MNDILKSCTLCPRECKVNRYEYKGFCGETAKVRIARAELHMWEEPCISGTEGSGTVFFSGCCLKCCFCQNYEISAQSKGFELTEQELADTFLRLRSMGANNINLVNPTHFVPQIIKALDLCKDKLTIPVVYNSGGYENPQTLELLRGYVQIFYPTLNILILHFRINIPKPQTILKTPLLQYIKWRSFQASQPLTKRA